MAVGNVKRETFAVHGLTSLIKDFKNLDKPVARRQREAFRRVGNVVRDNAQSRFSPINARSAAGYRTRVRQRGVAVAQSIRKTTGKGGKYGSLQMRKALLPALMHNVPAIERELERALDQTVRDFDRGGAVV